MFNKVQPQSIEAEMSVLGAMMMDKEAICKVVETLSKDAFYKITHHKIYNAILDLFERNEPVDLVTLTNELKKKGELGNIGGPLYLTTILNSISTSANVEYYIRIVNEKAILRKIIQSSTEILNMAYQPQEDVKLIMDKTGEMMYQVLKSNQKSKWTHIKDAMYRSLNSLEKMQVKGGMELSTGFIDIDRMTAGLHRGELVVIAGRPGHGKTSLALNIAYNLARQNRGVAFLTLEMSSENINNRLVCSIANISFQRFRAGYTKSDDWEKLSNSAAILSKLPLYFNDSSNPTAMGILALFKQIYLEKQPDAFIIDYLQRIGHQDNLSRYQQVSYDVRMMKQIAREFNIPVILLSSVRRQENEKVEPTLSTLKESGEIESEADTVMFIHREELYKPTPENEGVARILIEKQRNGPIGEVKLAFIKQYTRFENLSEREGK